MYERLLNLIDYEKDLNVKKELEIVKHKIDRGEDVKKAIYETQVYLNEMTDALLDSEYTKCIKKTSELLKKLLDESNMIEEKSKVVEDLIMNSNKMRKEQLKNATVEVNDCCCENKECHCHENNYDETEDCNCIPGCNKVAIALKTCAVIEGIIGYLAGVVMAYSTMKSQQYFPFALMITYFLITGVFIMFTWGMAELIQILHDIRKKLQ